MRISKPEVESAEVTLRPPSLVLRAFVPVAAEWITRRELVWLALLSPFLLFPDRRWVWLLAIVPALWVIRFIARSRFIPRTPLDWPIALLMTMVAVSLFATFNVEYSLPKIAGLLLGMSLYYALVEWAGTPERTGWAVGGFLASGAGLALLGLFGTNWLDKMQGLTDVTRGLPRVVPGLPGAENGFQPNEVGGTLVLVTLPAVALTLWAWFNRRSGPGTEYRPDESHMPRPQRACPEQAASPEQSRRGSRSGTRGLQSTRLRVPVGRLLSRTYGAWVRAAVLIVLILTVSTLVLTQSRGALTGAAIGSLLVLWLLLPRLRIWLAGAMLVGLAVLVANDPVAIANKLLQPSVAGYPNTDPANLRVRLDIWSSALAVIRDAPLTGSGMNTFRYIMPERYPSALIPPGWDVAHAHNVFLQVTIDLGLPGLIAYIAILVIATAMLVRTFRSAPSHWHRAVVAGLGAGLLAFLIFGITDTVALGAKPGVFFWALLAIGSVEWRMRNLE